MEKFQKALLKTSCVLFSLMLSGATLTTNLPNTFYQNFDNKEISADIEKVLQSGCFDPQGDRFFIEREETLNYVQSSRPIIENNTIRISLDKGLPEEYVNGATKAYELYKRMFEIINPNIKIEIGDFTEGYDIYIKKVDEQNGQNLMLTTGLLSYGKSVNGHSNFQRIDNPNQIIIYGVADEQDSNLYSHAFAHEFGHAILGLDDYNKSYSFEDFGYDGSYKQPQTIMRYVDLYNFAKISKDPKLTVLDLALAIQQWGLFSDNGVGGENPFNDEQEYYDYINEHLSEVCFTDRESMLVNDVAGYDGKISIINYLKLLNENKDKEMFPTAEESTLQQ